MGFVFIVGVWVDFVVYVYKFLGIVDVGVIVVIVCLIFNFVIFEIWLFLSFEGFVVGLGVMCWYVGGYLFGGVWVC